MRGMFITTEVSVVPMPLLHLLHPPDLLRGWGGERKEKRRRVIDTCVFWLMNASMSIEHNLCTHDCTYLPLSVMCIVKCGTLSVMCIVKCGSLCKCGNAKNMQFR